MHSNTNERETFKLAYLYLRNLFKHFSSEESHLFGRNEWYVVSFSLCWKVLLSASGSCSLKIHLIWRVFSLSRVTATKWFDSTGGWQACHVHVYVFYACLLREGLLYKHSSLFNQHWPVLVSDVRCGLSLSLSLCLALSHTCTHT